MSLSLEDGASFGSGGDFTMDMLLLTADRRIGSHVSAGGTVDLDFRGFVPILLVL